MTMRDTDTETDTESVPLATTLDEPTLRRVFANAPAEIGVPRDTRALFRLRMRRFRSAQRGKLLVVGLLAAIGVITSIAVQQPAGVIAIVIALLIALVIVLVVQHGRASNDFFRQYAAARGLDLVDDEPGVPPLVPMYTRGDKRKYQRYLAGTIAGQPAVLGHYTYTEVSTDSKGNRTETDYDFTVVQYPLPPSVAARFAGIYLSPRKLSFGALQDKLASDHKVELESAAFRKRFTLRVSDAQDEVALYELFSTTFIDQLATDLDVNWEQVGPNLVVYRKGHENEAADLDLLCLRSWHVLQRYLEEYM